MTDTVLDILKLVLLALLYLFFARVLWAVWSEVRAPKRPRVAVPAPGQASSTTPEAATAAASRPAVQPGNAGGSTRSRAARRARPTKLVVIEPKDRRGVVVPLHGEVTIGREATCTLAIPDDTYLSSTHARVFTLDDRHMVEDLGSTNGSFHNGNRLSVARPLHPGDRIQVGYTVLEVQ